MSAQTSVNVSGTWQTVSQPYAKVSGAWQPLQAIYAKVSGVWQLVYQSLSALVTDKSFSHIVSAPSTATAGYRLGSDGVAYTIEGATATGISGEWLLVGTNSDFECRMNYSGDTPSGSGDNVWESLSSDRTWSISVASGTKNTILSIEIRSAATLTVLTSASINMAADSS